MRAFWVFASLACAIAVASNSANAAVTPLAATGWNHDMVIEVGSAPYDTSVTGTMDGGFGQVENQTWVEKGLFTVWDGTQGVPDTQVQGLVAGTHSSLTGNGTFEFQPFDQNNVIGLDGGASGTLTLTEPGQFNSIALYGASGFGAKTATVTLAFDDASTSDYFVASGTGIGTDWFNTNSDVAFNVGGRASNKSEEGYTIIFYQENPIISINESLFDLTPADAAKTLVSVTVTNTGGDRMAVFALSGERVPEPGSMLMLALAGLTALGCKRLA